MKFQIQSVRMFAHQFLLAVPKQSAKRQIHFQNPPIEAANRNSNRGPLKHRLEAEVAPVIVCRRKLGHEVHDGQDF
jgi:hypothetical protein